MITFPHSSSDSPSFLQSQQLYQNQMNIDPPALEQGGDEFEQLKEELLTYALSEQLPSSPRNRTRKSHKSKTLQKHRLELVLQESNAYKELDIKQAGRSVRRMQSQRGRVIPVGQALFKSNFECGSIWNAGLIACNTYEIELQKQTNSNRISAWFYFSVQGVRGQAHFVIKGFTKSASLYNEGMKVCYRDAKELSRWRRGGSRISYTNSIENEEYQNSYELRFSHFFKNNQHTCIEFAYCFPYGLKRLYHTISHIKEHLTCQTLTKSFLGLDIPLLTVGNRDSKEVIVLSARVHSGQTVSSFIMEGFLKELVGDNQYGRMLRTKFLFKIVPMLNPDGVTKGNYRFSGYGCDLNRKWKSCKENYQPEVYHMRELIRNLNKEKKVIMYIDMHGHSRKKNVFFYGCCERPEGDAPINSLPKEFPYLMEKVCDAFKYDNCCFNVQKDKEGTARVTVWKDIKIDYVYTLESSFCGSQQGPNYLQADYEKIGRKLCEGIAVFFYSAPEKEKPQSHSEYRAIEKLTSMKEKAMSELRQNPLLLQVGEQDDSGSESQPQAGELAEKQRVAENGLPKPQSLIKQAKVEHRSKKMQISKKFFSQSSFRDKKGDKLKSQVSLGDELRTAKQTQRPQQDTIPSQSIKIANSSKYDRVEIKIANSVNTFELESLRASALYQKNVRVHSLTKNGEKRVSQSRRIVNPFSQDQTQQQRERLKMNLMHGRQGAQYRRVRKLAQQNLRKQLPFAAEQQGRVVAELLGNQFYIGQSQRQQKSNTISSRFYHTSQQQQRQRRTSADSGFKKSRPQEFKKISINGDQFSVRCKGKQIHF